MSRLVCSISTVSACIAMMLARDARAQTASPPSSTVALAIGATLPPGKRAMVLVRPTATPREIIVLGATATAEDVAASLAVVQHIARSFPAGMRQELRAYPSRFKPAKNWDLVGKPKFQRYLDDAKTAQERAVDGLGTVRVLDVPLDKASSS